MLKQTSLFILFVLFLSSCSSLKTAFSGNRQNSSGKTATAKNESKFLDIDVPVETRKPAVISSPVKKSIPEVEGKTGNENSVKSLESDLSYLQVKYAVILNTPAEDVKNSKMFEFIDDWYGTPYKLGGTTKTGIDCSAFSQFLLASVYGFSIPRTAREQYRFSNRISRTELQEGDLVFFNTRGGISHVGVYLQNNKFVHASTSGGVTISDLFEDYWVRKFAGVGRLKDKEAVASAK